jgi:ribosomal protein L31E
LQPSAKPEEFTSSPALKTTTAEAINLRSRYIELSKKKAELMKEDQLKHEIETLERQIPELEAWAKAEEAVRLLREVIEKHPNTDAAKCAQSAIELIQGRGEDFRREEFVPRPDDRTPNRRFREGRRAPAPHDPGPSLDDPRRAPPRGDFQPKPEKDAFPS